MVCSLHEFNFSRSVECSVDTSIGSGTGDQPLRDWAHEFTNTVFKPACSDFEILLNFGNTDGWNKIVRMLCEPGDFILVEQYTYPSAQALWIPMGCVGVPIKSDSQGMSPEDLDSVLTSWDEARPGVKRPHLFSSLVQKYIADRLTIPQTLSCPGWIQPNWFDYGW